MASCTVLTHVHPYLWCSANQLKPFSCLGSSKRLIMQAQFLQISAVMRSSSRSPQYIGIYDLLHDGTDTAST